jgi:hypothetical protein
MLEPCSRIGFLSLRERSGEGIKWTSSLFLSLRSPAAMLVARSATRPVGHAAKRQCGYPETHAETLLRERLQSKWLKRSHYIPSPNLSRGERNWPADRFTTSKAQTRA